MKYKLSEDEILVCRISSKINQWLHSKKGKVDNYVNYIDRVAEIGLEVQDAITEGRKMIEKNKGQIYTKTCSKCGRSCFVGAFGKSRCCEAKRIIRGPGITLTGLLNLIFKS